MAKKRKPKMELRYYKMPEATAAAIDADGWLHTGDLARRDENGNYKITGRIKDMMGTISIISIFIIIWKSDSAMKDRDL